MTSNIKHNLLTYTTRVADTSSPYIFDGPIPWNGTTKQRLYLTYFDASEHSNSHCIYPYYNKTEALIGTPYYEPLSLLFYRNIETNHNVYEVVKIGSAIHSRIENYVNGEIIDLVGITVDTIDSSFDNHIPLVPKLIDTNNSGTWSTFSTNTSLYNLERLVWLDGAVLRFNFVGEDKPTNPSNITRTTEWIPLIKCLKEGIPAQEDEKYVYIELGLPDLCTLTIEPFTNNDGGCLPDKYSGGFYPYNDISVTIKMHTQPMTINSSTNKEVGLYYNTVKVRRLFIGTNEIRYLVLDEED